MIQKSVRFAAIIFLSQLLAPYSNLGQDVFRDGVAPLLERKCLSCHNDQQQSGDFSLESSDGAFADGYIEAGNAGASHVIELITPVNGNFSMPKNTEPLTTEEIKLLRSWIDAGAHWPSGLRLAEPQIQDFDWWSFQPINRPPVPSLEATAPWVRTPIDAFILNRLKEKGLSHSPEADRRTLIRRLTFDLTGLPPSPQETESFVNDPDPAAYEKLVDRLLASKHYGERWARHWLDVVKYADTCGYDKDKLRPNAWPYRDYVIRSFNQDKPYAQFVQEQIAGDVLFPGKPDGILGLGFIAAGPWDFIGHVEVDETKIDGKVARNLDRDDMVSNTINTFCSVTIQCARCHHHKFDPFTQQHYYALQSVFAAVDRAERPYQIDKEVENKRQDLESQLDKRESDLNDVQREIEGANSKRLAQLRSQRDLLRQKQRIQKALEFGYHSTVAESRDTKKWVEVELANPVDVSRIVLRACHDEFAGIGAGFGFPHRYTVEVTATARSKDNAEWTTVADYSQQDVPNPGLKPIEIECDEKDIIRIRMTATRLAERQNDFIFALAELQAFSSSSKATNLAATGTVTALDSIEAPVRWARANLTDGKWARSQDPETDSRLAELTQQLDVLIASAATPERITRRKMLRATIASLKSKLKSLPTGPTVYSATTTFSPQGSFKPTHGQPREIRLLHRGDVQSPGDEIGPGALPLKLDADWQFDNGLSESERRAELARWMTNRDHPLVWRSIVNRVWQYHFGQGIVATPNDFGHMGAKPTHPDLLDWLACEFRDGNQSIKALHRLIVTSSVYRQASDGVRSGNSTMIDANATIDGGNHFLWKMNRRRLEAEEIRDSILLVSGTLDRTMGGPGYYLFELEKTEHSPHFEYHKFDHSDPDSHRRGIYRFIARSQPNPWMTTLDCADSSQSTPRRNETLTSLQALSLLNNQFNLVMAEKMAKRLQMEAESLPEQIELAIQLTTQRRPTTLENMELTKYAQQHGLKNLCRFLFNLSEFVYLD